MLAVFKSKKYYFLNVFVLLLVLNLFFGLSHAEAKSIEASLNFPKDIIYPNELTQGYVQLYNPNNKSIEVFLSFYAEGYESYITQDAYYVTLSPHSTKKIHVYFYAPYYATPQPYEIYLYVYNKNRTSILAESKHIIYVLKSPTLKIISLYLSSYSLEPGDSLRVYFGVKNYGTVSGRNYSVNISIIKGSEIYRSKLMQLPIIKPKKTFSSSILFNFNRHTDKGNYSIHLQLIDSNGDVVDHNTTFFTIKPEPIFKISINSTNYLFSKIVNMDVVNQGNVKGVKEVNVPAIGWDIVYDFLKSTPKNKYIDGKEYFSFSCTLNPGQHCYITYRIDYWMYYLVLLILLLFVVLLFIQFTKPTIKKKYFKKGRKYKVLLEVINRSNKEIKEVKVVDKVPGIVQVDRSSMLPMPSKIRKIKGGEEMIWNLGNMKPKEERVITYDVIPRIGVLGDLEFHYVEMHATTHKGNNIHVKSKARKHDTK